MGQSYQSNFVVQYVHEFVELIDKYLEADGTIKDSIDVKEHYGYLGEDEIISFDKFYEIFSKNLLDSDKIDYEAIIETAEEKKRQKEIEKFKKKTDRLI